MGMNRYTPTRDGANEKKPENEVQEKLILFA